MPRILVVDDSATLRRVVCAILERNGFSTVAAADGQAALDTLEDPEVEKPDLVLLDFVMPRMNGYQFCRALRQKDETCQMPVVLMSAKGDRIRDQFVLQTGALDAITKPFDAQALVAVVQNALRRVEAGRESAKRLPELDDDDLLDDDDSQHTDPGVLALRSFAAKLAPLLAPHLGEAPKDVLGEPALLGRMMIDRISADALERFAQSLQDLEFSNPDRLALRGDVSIIPLGGVLQMLQVEGQTGVLTITSGDSQITVSLRGGLIDLVQSRGTQDEFRLGRFFIEEGLILPTELDALLKEDSIPPPVSGVVGSDDSPPNDSKPRPATRKKRLLGDALLHSGRVTETQLKAALVRQSSELVYEALRWQKGRFEFRRQPLPPLAQSARLALPMAAVVMEGFRRVDEWRVLEGVLGSFEDVLVRDDAAVAALAPDALQKPEQIALAAIDGERTLREVVAATHMSSFDACRILTQLLQARLVRRKAG
jgi:DNA-binding response OmpR family regulator